MYGGVCALNKKLHVHYPRGDGIPDSSSVYTRYICSGLGKALGEEVSEKATDMW